MNIGSNILSWVDPERKTVLNILPFDENSYEFASSSTQIEFETQIKVFKLIKSSIHDNMAVVMDDSNEIAYFKIQTRSNKVDLDQLNSKQFVLPKVNMQVISKINTFEVFIWKNYASLILAENFNLIEVVFNIETGLFHQKIRTYNIQQSFPFYSHPFSTFNSIQYLEASESSTSNSNHQFHVGIKQMKDSQSYFKITLDEQNQQIIVENCYIQQKDSFLRPEILNLGRFLFVKGNQICYETLDDNLKVLYTFKEEQIEALKACYLQYNASRIGVMTTQQLYLFDEKFQLIKQFQRKQTYSSILEIRKNQMLIQDDLNGLVIHDLSKDEVTKAVQLPILIQKPSFLLQLKEDLIIQIYCKDNYSLIRFNQKETLQINQQVAKAAFFQNHLYLQSKKSLTVANFTSFKIIQTLQLPEYLEITDFICPNSFDQTLYLLTKYEAWFESEENQQFPNISCKSILENYLLAYELQENNEQEMLQREMSQKTSQEKQVQHSIYVPKGQSKIPKEKIESIEIIQEWNIVLVFGNQSISFFQFKCQDGSLSLKQLPYKQKIKLIGDQENYQQEQIALENSEFQVILRDVNNKVPKPELSLLNEQDLFVNERVICVKHLLVNGILEVYLFTTAGVCYLYHGILQYDFSATKLYFDKLLSFQYATIQDLDLDDGQLSQSAKLDDMPNLVDCQIGKSGQIFVKTKKRIICIEIEKKFDSKKQKFIYEENVKEVMQFQNEALCSLFADQQGSVKVAVQDLSNLQLKIQKLT